MSELSPLYPDTPWFSAGRVQAGSEYYATGFMGLMDGAHAIGHGETGWTGV